MVRDQRSGRTKRLKHDPQREGDPSRRLPRRRGGPARLIACAALLCLALAVPVRAAGDAPLAPADRLEQIRTALTQGNAAHAYQLLEDADWDVTKLPADQLANLAELDLQLWRYGLAIRIARLALDRHGKPPAPIDEPVDPLVQRMNRVLAISLYLTARGGGPTPELARVGRDQALETSESLFRDLVTAPQGNPRDAFWLALVLTERDKKDEAREVLDRYLSTVDPKTLHGDAERLSACLNASLPDNIGTVASAPGLQPPQPIESPHPQYTEAARHAGLQGTVELTSIIDAKGQPICVRPESGLPLGLTEIAVRTFANWRFKPARLDGKPTPIPYSIKFNFSNPHGK